MPSSLPRWNRRDTVAFQTPAAAAFPLYTQGRLPRHTFSGPARRSLALRPAPSRNRFYTALCIEGFDEFVTSFAASIATGRSNLLPGQDLHPPENNNMNSTAHVYLGIKFARPSRFAPACHCGTVPRSSHSLPRVSHRFPNGSAGCSSQPDYGQHLAINTDANRPLQKSKKGSATTKSPFAI